MLILSTCCARLWNVHLVCLDCWVWWTLYLLVLFHNVHLVCLDCWVWWALYLLVLFHNVHLVCLDCWVWWAPTYWFCCGDYTRAEFIYNYCDIFCESWCQVENIPVFFPHVVGAQLYRLSTVDAHTDVLKSIHGKIIWHYSRYCAVAFCYEHKCELSYIHPGLDVKLHAHRVKLYQIGCVGSGLVLAKALA